MLPVDEEKPHSLSVEQMENLVRASFLAHSVGVDDNSVEGTESCPFFSIKELKETVLSVKNKKVFWQRYINCGFTIPRPSAWCIQPLPEPEYFTFPLEGGEARLD